MNILNILSSVVAPVTKLIDELHTSDEEKLVIKNQMLQIQAAAYNQAVELEKQTMRARTDIIRAEANGQSWLQRSWRPVTMLTFLMLVVADSFGWLANPLASEAWTLL